MSIKPAGRANLTGAFACCLLLCVLDCGDGGGQIQQNNGGQGAGLSQVNISPQSPSLLKGGTVQLKAIAVYSGGTQQDVTTSAIWTSNNAAIATVTSSGVVNGDGVGTAQISASYGNFTGTDLVVISPSALVSLSVTPNPLSLPLGESVQMIATGTFNDGSTQDLTASAIWSSSSPGIAPINASGQISAAGLGGANVSATSGNMSGQAQVTVTSAVPVALNVTPGSTSVVIGGSLQFQAILTYSDGTTENVTGTTQWSSSNSNIVNINGGGLLTGLQVGDATISATNSNFDVDATVGVNPVMLLSYFDLATAQATNTDGTLYIAHPGFTSGNLCAMIYVFDQNQEMSECCGCAISDSGLRILSLSTDLTNNSITGVSPRGGIIAIVPSEPSQGGQCNAASSSPNSVLIGWNTNAQNLGGATSQLSEVQFNETGLSTGQQSTLANLCGAIQTLGGGQGVCSCGVGN
jgi:hypothetical protein